MKKTISGVLLALASVCALAACKKDKTTKKPDGTTKAGTTKKDIVANGREINFYCWNNEFQTRLRKYYPAYGKQISAQSDLLADGTAIVWTMIANANGSYQAALDAALAGKQDGVSADMFCFEADYAAKYVKSEYSVDMETLGIKDAMGAQYQYTKDAVTDANGKLKGSSWQGCPGCICFNETIAKDLYGAEYTLEKASAAISTDKATFDGVAAALEAKNPEYGMMIGYADWYRVYGNNLSDKMFKGGDTITLDKNLFQYAIDTKAYNEAGYLLGDTSEFGLWGGKWGSNMAAGTKAYTIFACPWFTDYSLKDNCKVEAGQSSPWRVTPGYASWFWGGTWLTATNKGIEDANKKATIADIIKQMTCNKDVLLALSDGELDFTNNKEAMEAKGADAKATNVYFGGQNVYAIYAKSVLNASLAKASDYDQYITEDFQNLFLPFIQGDSDAATCLAALKTSLHDKTGKTIEVAEGVTVAATGITIA